MPERQPWVTSAPALDSLTRESWEITSREAWAERRGKDITASVAPNLIEGADPYGNMQKVVDHLNGVKVERSPSMRPGILLEAVFPEAIREVHPEWVIEKASTYHRIAELRLGCTPDFWVKPDGLIQAKTCSERVWESWRGRPPLGYTLQTLCELIVTGRAWGVLAVIVRSDLLPLYLYAVPRHARAEAKLLAAVAGFWRQFDAGEWFVPVPKDEIAADLDDGSHIDLSSDNRLPEWLERREQLMAEIREAERSKRGIEYEVKNRMGKAMTAYLPGWDIAWHKRHRNPQPALDYQQLNIRRTKETNGE